MAKQRCASGLESWVGFLGGGAGADISVKETDYLVEEESLGAAEDVKARSRRRGRDKFLGATFDDQHDGCSVEGILCGVKTAASICI